MRLIDADALIIDLMDAGLDQIQMGDYSEVIQVIERQPTAYPWHRVDEPPKENGRYLVSWGGVVTTDEYENGVWLYASIFNQRITHWMPIEPPKEEK